ncbi:hypothetical protein ACIRSS_14310 [Amycolatopsis sp. NPDC101161]|uniref:hypothetical protein n=1 Tax=Amycolatopsis sp. NPDC101161 TaxID=3363940 RepID=UPI0038055481
MTSYPEAATGFPQPAPVAAPSRPGALLALAGVAVLSALAAIVDGVLYFVGGRDLALDVSARTIASITGTSADSVKADGGALLQAAADEVRSTLQVRGGLAVFFGVVLLVWGLLALRGAAWVRVLLTLAALANAGVALRLATDIEGGTAAIRAVAWLVVVTGLAAAVLSWLPAVNRYAKARKGH